MGKLSLTKKDNFAMHRNKKKINTPTSTQEHSRRPLLNNKQTATGSSSGDFFIKEIDKPHHTKGAQKNSFDNSSKGFFVKPRRTDTKTTNFKPHNSSKRSNQEQKTTKLSDKPKKPFDKKQWRLQKYSKKFKLDQWEERRMKVLLQEFRKQIENEPVFDVQKIYDKFAADEEDKDNENNLNALESPNASDAPTSKSSTKSRVKLKPHEEFQRKQIEKKLKKEEIQKKKAEKAEALKVYKQKKLEKYKKLNKKTKKGQPVMKYRMEMLLEQIQKSLE